MLTVLNSPQKTTFQARKIPSKRVTIIHKNGRDVIKDEFVGFHVVRPNLFSILKSILDDLFCFLQK